MSKTTSMDKYRPSSPGGNFLVQGSILAAAGILVRFIGLLYRIPMTRILGDAGNGYYSTTFEIYNIGLILSSYGLPLAVSKLVAARRVREQYEDVRRIFRSGLVFGLVSGGLMTGIMMFGADWITTTIFKSPSCALSLRVLAPTILVFSVMGVIRGYFQGLGDMVPTSVSQIIEQIVNAAISIAASYAFMAWFASHDNPGAYGAAGGTLGTLSGAVAAFVFLLFLLLRYQRQHQSLLNQAQSLSVETWGTAYAALFLTMTPIILSQFVYQVSGSLDNSMFNLIMSNKGFSEQERATLFGIYSTKYRLLSNVPVAIASALGASMIPSIVRSRVQKQHGEVRYKIYMTVKFNMLIAIPCAVGLGVLASPIMRLLFGDSRALTAQLMQLGAPAVVFFSLSTVTNAVLQGTDLMRKSVTHSAISLAIHIVLVYLMVRWLDWGAYGLVIGNVTFALVVCVLNWISIGKHLHYRQEVKTTFLLPMAAAALMGVVAYAAYHGSFALFHSNKVSLLISIPLSMLLYGILLAVFRAVDETELMDMPFGRRLAGICKKVHLL